MRISESTLDDLLLRVYRLLLKKKSNVVPRKGANSEELGLHLILRNPRARLSRTESRSLLFGQLGELLWYLSGKDAASTITYYLPKYPTKGEANPRTIRSAYGPRLVSPDGISYLEWVVDLLKHRPDTRRAVIPIYTPADLAEHLEVPCTCSLQFFNRNGKLVMITHMRSNDVFVGLPGDVFSFTMIQELVARALGLELGTYHTWWEAFTFTTRTEGRHNNLLLKAGSNANRCHQCRLEANAKP